MNDQLWTTERALWLEGPDRFRATMAADAVMVFPEPVGILRGPQILGTLEGVPRWIEVTMTEKTFALPSETTAVLAYRAEARRTEGATYRALCTSCYAWLGGDWRIVQHQHTPIAG